MLWIYEFSLYKTEIFYFLSEQIWNSEMSFIFAVIIILAVSPLQHQYAALTLPLTQGRDSTVLTELDMMVMVKKKFLTTRVDSNGKSSWMSNMMKKFPSQESKLGRNSENRVEVPSENSEHSICQYNYNFPYGIIARKGILMQMK